MVLPGSAGHLRGRGPLPLLRPYSQGWLGPLKEDHFRSFVSHLVSSFSFPLKRLLMFLTRFFLGFGRETSR